MESKYFRVWYATFDGEEDYTIIKAMSEEDAKHSFMMHWLEHVIWIEETTGLEYDIFMNE